MARCHRAATRLGHRIFEGCFAGPKYVVKKGKTPVLTAEEARDLLDSIPIVRKRTRRTARKQKNGQSSGCATALSSR